MRSSIPLYDVLAEDYEDHFSVPHRWAYDELSWSAVRDGLGPPEAGRPVVDAGCGIGRWAERFVGLGHEVIGIEQSPRMLGGARSRGLGDRCAILEGSMEQIELPSSRAAAVVAMGSLQYTVDPLATLARFSEWTMPDGMVAVLVDGLAALVVELGRAGRLNEAEQRRRTRRGEWVAGGQTADLHLFDAASLRTAMIGAGLVDVEVRGLLCGWTVLGREQVLDDLTDRPGATLEREASWSTDPAMADLGKQLLGLARAPG